MTIPAIPPIGAAPGITPPGGADAAPGAGFADAMGRGLQQVSGAEHQVDALMQDVATGGTTSVHDLMIATSEAQLATDVLVSVRDRALESYHEIMRLQL